jgi:nicotinamide-nucleotide amidase
MNGEIICIGTELLLGDTLNSNSQYLSQELSALGINLFYHTVVGDNTDRLKKTISLAAKRSDIIITTGGLGPTQDDLTKETIAEFLDMPLELHKPSLKYIETFFKNTKRKMTTNNIKQAYIPTGSIVVHNDNGTAPGIIVEKNNIIFILLPGPPKEMVPMFEKSIIPYILKKEQINFHSRYYKVVGIGESSLEDKLLDIVDNQTNPTLATYAGYNEVLLRLTANSKDENIANEILQPYEDLIYNRIGENIYGGKQDTLEKVTANFLINNNITFSIAESCTGGLIASRLTSIPKISNVFHSGIVCYSNNAKENIIGVSPNTLKSKGAVSPEVAEELCRNLYDKTQTDLVMSVTGIAGPDGATDEKPIGLIYIGLLYKGDIEISKYYLTGNRVKIQERTSQLALNILRKKIISII